MARKLTSEKREDLREAAIRVFREKGYREATVKDIVEEAGASTATFYRYFKTKDDLYVELVTDFLIGFTEIWGVTYTTLSESTRDKDQTLGIMGHVVRTILDYYRENRDMAKVVFRRIVPLDDRFAEQGQRIVQATFEQLEEMIGVMKTSGFLQDMEPRVAAAVAIGAVFGVAIECVVDDQRDDVDELAHQVMGLVEHGIFRQEK